MRSTTVRTSITRRSAPESRPTNARCPATAGWRGSTSRGPLTPSKLHGLLDILVDPDDLSYRVPWCGRFSVPFGLEVLRKVALETEGSAPRGKLLSYGTSLSGPELPVSAEAREGGLGYTAPSNFHHWVGYAAVGYLMP